MNLFLRECRANRKSMLIWCVCSILLVVGVLAKYSGLSENDQQINQLIARMPKAIQFLMGGGAYDYTKVSGYFGVTYGYLQLVTGIYALILGSGIISKEEGDKTVEFLLTKPVSRRKILAVKLLNVFCTLAVFSVLLCIFSIISVKAVDSQSDLNAPISLLFIALFLFQLIFASLGAMLAASVKKPKLPVQIGTAVLFTSYIITILMQISESIHWLRPLTPFSYWDTAAILNGGNLDAVYSIAALALTAAFCVVAFINYQKRDMKV